MSDDSFVPGPATRPDEVNLLTWDDSFTIALSLSRDHPDVDLEQVSLGMIYRWTLELPEFADDPQLVNEEILSAIIQEWLEEVITQ